MALLPILELAICTKAYWRDEEPFPDNSLY
jgi:hypothetical protein